MFKLENIKIENIYILFLVTIAVWAAIAFSTIEIFFEKQEHYGKLINISGMQRMLSQKIQFTAHRAIELNSSDERKVTYKALALMQRNHAYLIAHIHTDKIRSLYYDKPYNVDQKTLLFIANAKQFIRNNDHNGFTRIDQNDVLLNHLNLVVKSIEQEYESNLKKFLILESGIWILAIAIVTLEAFYLLIPAIKSIKEAQMRSNTLSIAKNEFIANISHELRTPINGLLGFIELLRKKETDPSTKKYLDVMDDSAQNLNHIIQDILEYSKISSGAFRLDKECFDLHSAVIQTVDSFKDLADSKHIQYLKNTISLPHAVIGDTARVVQIMTILINNAIKFTPSNELIKLKSTYNESTHYFRFAIKDTGIGMSSEKINTVYEPFTQVDGSYTRKHGGIGLGLSIVKCLIDAMNGTMSIESQEKIGTTVVVEIHLPLA